MNLLTGLFASVQDQANALVADLRRSVVFVDAGDGQGAGVVWSGDGLIVTNHHVARRDRVFVEGVDGIRRAAAVVARDLQDDLALLRVEETSSFSLPAASFGDARALRVGEVVVAVGNPFGVAGTATLGIVSGTGGATWRGRARRDVLQADVALAPGNSGGPLANVAGEVVGIASMILSPGIALAVPAHVVRGFVGAALPATYRRAA